jgi:hypothetical protein
VLQNTSSRFRDGLISMTDHRHIMVEGLLPPIYVLTNIVTLATMRRKITNETWEQIKTGYAAGIGLREVARKMGIAEGTILSHAKRHGWRQQIQAATQELTVMQSDAITPMQSVQSVQSVPQSLAAILAERKERTRLGLSKYTAEAAEQAAVHPDKLEIAGKVKDVADVHKTLWPPEHNQREQILNLAVLIGDKRPHREIEIGNEKH